MESNTLVLEPPTETESTVPEIEMGTAYFRECETADDAKRLAYDEALATGGLAIPVTWFVQGQRNHLSFAMTLRDVAQLARRNSAVKGDDPRAATNRPLVPEHARGIEDYLVQNALGTYILPSLTLTAGSPVSVYAVRAPSKIKSGFLVLSRDATLYVTDGQHRLVALTGDPTLKGKLIGALNRNPDLGTDAVAIDLVLESEPEQIHQDFADAAQTLKMPPSMLAAYNQREPFNRVLNQITSRSALLAGRVDMSSTTLSKNSQKLFLLNQVRGFLKELIIGDYAASEDTVGRVASEQLATKEQQDEWIERALNLLDHLSRAMTPWDQVLKLKVGAPESSKVSALREEYLNLSATGLNLIGRLGHLLLVEFGDDAVQRQVYIDRLAKLDWRRTAKLWDGNVIIGVSDTARFGKILTNRAPLSAAFTAIKSQIGLAGQEAAD